jgi:mannan endo-1,4-beta-mannosidase
LTYPGSNYVDWLGVDAYSNCGASVPGVFDGIVGRLRTIDSTKALGVNEVGISSFLGTAAKNAWITDYWNYVYANDIRMSLWFNTDKGTDSNCAVFEKPWAFFGKNHGDTTYTHCEDSACLVTTVYRGFSAYRTAVQQPWVIRTNWSGNPRYFTDDQFLGR